MKNGFTLVELLGVIVILGILAVIAFPTIINQITSARKEINDSSNLLIFDAAENYFLEYANLSEETGQKYYCVTLEQLVDDGLLNEPLKDAETEKEYDITKTSVRMKYEGGSKFGEGEIGPTTTFSCIKMEAGD